MTSSPDAERATVLTCLTCQNYQEGFRGGFCFEWGARDVPPTGFCYLHKQGGAGHAGGSADGAADAARDDFVSRPRLIEEP
jgi:hypothetical protein